MFLGFDCLFDYLDFGVDFVDETRLSGTFAGEHSPKSSSFVVLSREASVFVRVLFHVIALLAPVRVMLHSGPTGKNVWGRIVAEEGAIQCYTKRK